VAGSTKPVGRLDFVLRILAATALAVEWNRVFPLKDLLNPVLHMYRAQSEQEVLFYIACYPFVAILMMSATIGRLLDAKLSVLYIFPITFIWIFSTVTFMFGLHYWPFGLALFVFMLIMGGILPINPAPVRIGFVDKGEEQSSDTDTSNDKVKRRQFNPGSPLAFLIILIILASLWLPLIYLDDISGHGAGVWIARVGYAILGFFWISLSVNRFKDAGLLDGRFFPYLIAVSAVSLLPLIFNLTNGYESLAIFVLIQTPITLLRSKPSPEEPLEETEEDEKCLRDPLGGIPARNKDDIDIAYTEPKPPVFTGISSGSSKKVPSWRRY
jgi:hypothetical protein